MLVEDVRAVAAIMAGTWCNDAELLDRDGIRSELTVGFARCPDLQAADADAARSRSAEQPLLDEQRSTS